jgi:hypothetical protein
MMIAFPPCTYLCSSGMHWTTRGLRDPKLTEEALAFVHLLLNSGIHRIAIENPVGAINTRICKPSQIIQPWQFGDDASKSTCLWLKNLPLLRPTKLIEGRIVNGKRRWANQTDSGQNRLGPSEDRWKKRSETYQGIAEAMAAQWGNLAGGQEGQTVPQAELTAIIEGCRFWLGHVQEEVHIFVHAKSAVGGWEAGKQRSLQRVPYP